LFPNTPSGDYNHYHKPCFMRKFYFLLISLLTFAISNAQITVAGGTTAVGSYTTLSAAVTAINGAPVTGAITVDVVAGHTETLTARISLTATGTAANPIVIQKSGAGANPVLTSYVGTALPSSAVRDGMFSLEGSDYVTIDGINLLENAANTTETTCMEYGYGLFKASVTNGAQSNTIKNCTITLNRVGNTAWTAPGHNGSVGIVVLNGTAGATGALTPTASGGSNSFNKIYSNTIQNCNAGIVFVGFAATAGVGPNPDAATFLGDLGNDVGGSSASTGNTVLNFGGGAAATNPATGIFMNQQWSSNVSYNTINNNNGSGVNHVSTLRGIFLNSSSTSASANCNNNTITIKGGATTSQVALIENAFGGTAAGNTVNINNNTLTGDYLTATSGTWYGIYNNATAPATLNVNNNTISNVVYSAAALAGSGTVYPIYTGGSSATSTFNISSNTIQNISRVGTTGGTTIGIYAQGGTTGMVTNVNSNTVSGLSINGSGTASTLYGIQTVTGTISVNGNTVSNLQCLKASGTAALYGIYNLSSPVNENVNNNTVNQLIHAGTGTVMGIYHFTSTGTRNMVGNTIYNLSTAGVTATGLHSASSSPNIYKNKIYDVVSTNAAPTVSGIVQGSLGTAGTATIYNNLIGDLRAPNAVSTTSPSVRGINLTTTTSSANLFVYYNTVRLAATSVGATFSTAALYATVSATSTTANLTLLNNIFIDNSTPKGATGFATAYWRSGTALNNFNAASNKNVYYAGTPGVNNLVFYDGTNSDQTLAAYKTRVATAESASATENVAFLSTTGSSTNFLHIDPAVPTQVESGGAAIAGITTDFDGDTRNASTPDIGADEGTFTLLDILPPNISYTPLSFTCSGNARTLTATITDASGVPTSGTGLPVLYWKINAGTYSAATATYVSGSTYSFSFGAGAVLGDVISYYILAQDNASTPNIGSFPSVGAAGFTANPPAASTAPTTPSTYSIAGTLSGIYTVGATGTYATLTAALADYITKCLTGPVEFSLIDPLYSTSETFPLTINQHPDASATNTLTIRPAAGVTTSITGSVASNGLIRVLGSHVIIDGSNNGSGFQNLSIQNTNTTSPRVILAGSTTTTPLVNVTLKNFYALNGSKTSTSAQAIQISNSVGAAGNFNNIVVENISVSTSYIGISALANVAAGNGSGLIIRNNGLDVSGATSINYTGIYVQGTDGALITNNRIGNFDGTTGQTDMGIWLATGTVNTVIEKNTIYNLVYTGTAGYSARGIYLTAGVSNSNNLIKNNMIYNMGGDGDDFATFGNQYNPTGIYLAGATPQTGVEISNNTIFLSGNYINGTGTYVNGIALDDNSTASIRNNIIVNTSGIAAAGTGVGPVAIVAENSAAQFTALSNNAYNIAASGTGTNNIGKIGATDYATLAAFQAATSADANSKVTTPVFVSSTNLHLSTALGDNICLNGAGTPLANVTDDFDGNPRDASTPDIGADEFALTTPTLLTNAQSACFGGSVDLTAASVTAGSTAGQTFGYFTDAACTNAIASPAAVTTGGTYYIKATFTSGGCSIEQISPVVVTINALPTVAVSVAETSGTTANDGTICVGGSATLTASGATTYTWAPGGATTAAITVSPTTTTTYTVTGTDANGCQNTASTTITVNALPTPTITVVDASGATNNDGTICFGASASLTAAGGTSYSWAPGGATTAAITVSPTATTNYVVTVTNANGCVNTSNTTITVTALPTQFSVTGGGPYCSAGVGSAVGLSGSETGVTYQLVQGGTTNVGAPVTGTGSAISFGLITTAGTYTVVATNATTTCTQNMTGSVTVSISPLPVISLSTTEPITCVSTNGAATLTITGAAGPYTYNWTGTGSVQGQQNQTTLQVGAYSVTVTAANTCQATTSFSLIGPGGCDVCPTIGALTSTPNAVCQAGTTTLSATGLTDLGISYGIRFVVSTTPLANPYTTGTVVATIPNASLGVTTVGPPQVNNASTTYNFNTPGINYVYAILSPTPADPACRPFRSVQINVVATPNVNTVANQTVCSGALTTAVTFSGTQPGTVFNWTNSNPSIGLAATGTGNIASFTATNFTNAPVTSTITVTPVNNYNASSNSSVSVSCPGPSKTFTFTVNPIPTVNTVSPVFACNGATVSVPFSGFVAGTVFEWTNSNTAIGLAASGTGNLSFTGTNSGTTPISANIVVTPKYTNNGQTCTGTPIAFTVTINPTPTVNTVSNQLACNSGATTAVNFSGAVTGTTYSWTNSNASIGLAASGTGNIASFTAVNTGTAPVTATITVTPNYTNGGTTCSGTATTFTITVNPQGQVNTVSNHTICNGANTTAVNFSTNNTGVTTTYSWTNSNTSIGLAASGTGNIPSFAGVNTGTTPVTATVTVTPSYTITCTGTPTTFTFTVNPTPTVNAVSSEVVCNNASTTAVTFSGAVTGTVYNWTNSNTAIGLAASGTGNIASFTATNSTSAPITATITVTPSYTNGGVTCTGTSTSYTITVNPTPTVNAVSNQTVCNGGATTAVTFSGAVAGTVYNWVNTTPSIGLAASGTGNIASFAGVNTGTTPVTATITVTPSFLNGGTPCSGTPRTFTITVNPTPTVSAVSNQVVCNGANTTAVAFSGAVAGTVYDWTNNAPAIGLAAAGTGNIASFAAVNTGITPITATIIVTPSYTNNGVTCTGTPTTFTITVNPTPTVNTVANQVLCNGSATTAVTLTGAVTGTVYSWTNNTPSIGLAASGTATVPSFTAVNTGVTPIVATITVTPSFTSGGITCTGTPRTFTITVNPTPTVNQPASQVVCNRSNTTAVTFTGAVTGTVYNWTNSNTAIGLAASGTGDIAAFAAVNTTQTPVVATITVTPSFTNGGVTCTGTPRTFTITVNPTPIVVATDLFNQRICISDGAIALNATPVGGSWSGIGVSGFNFIPGSTAVGNYVLTYTYTNQFGCSSSDTTTAKVFACDERNRSLAQGGAILFPNPNGGQFNIRVNSTRFQFLQARIYNALGQLVATKQWNGLVYGQVLPIDMRHLAAGIYTVRIIYDGGNLYEDKGYQMLIAR